MNPDFQSLAGADAGPSPGKRRRGQAKIDSEQWRGAQGLAEDVRFYGRWMRDEAEKRIGHLYPKVEITSEMVRERPDLKQYEGRKLTVIAWLWARTVKSPNPAFADVDVPLVSTWMLSTKKGKEAYVEPVIEGRGYRFKVETGPPEDQAAAKRGTKLSTKATFRCLMSDSPIPNDHIKAEGLAQRMGQRLLAIVAKGDRSRVYLAADSKHEQAAQVAFPSWRPELNMPCDRRWFSPPLYGLPSYGDIFTPRQLAALTTFSDLVGEAIERVREDTVRGLLAKRRPLVGEGGTGAVAYADKPLRDGGTGATAYAEAVGVYLALLVNQVANHSSSACGWNNVNAQMRSVFARQAIPMVWDYAESNPFCASSGSYTNLFERQLKGFLALGRGTVGTASQDDVCRQSVSSGKLVSTDPPYYDNIGYADLSDFFYVWLRRALRLVLPDLFATVGVPKAEELVASPYRHGGKGPAERFFLTGMTRAMRGLAGQAHTGFPMTIYYAFKQSESRTAPGPVSTGWETFLDAVIRAGFAVSGTWPLRTEKKGRVIGINTNALASSIVLVCRPRSADAPLATRREFLGALRRELPSALHLLQEGNIAPVDLAQAAIGPGMRVYTRYAKVLHATGETMTVREALALINEVLAEILEEQEGDSDADSRWALAWFEEHAFEEGEFGRAELLSKAKDTSIDGMVEAGIVHSAAGRVRLLRPAELPEEWDPREDSRLVVWEVVHHLVRSLETGGGEEAAAALVRKLGGGMAETARDLCYRLYTVCERRKRAREAQSYNGLVQSWPEIQRLAQHPEQVRIAPS